MLVENAYMATQLTHIWLLGYIRYMYANGICPQPIAASARFVDFCYIRL